MISDDTPMIVGMARLGPRAVRSMAERWLCDHDLENNYVLTPAAALRGAGFRLRSSAARHLGGMTLASERVAFVARGGDAIARLRAGRHELGHAIQFDSGLGVGEHCETSCDRLGLCACLPSPGFADALREAGPDPRDLRAWYATQAEVNVSQEDLAMRAALQLGGYALLRGARGALRVLWADAANDLPLERQFQLSQLGDDAWTHETARASNDGAVAIPYRDRSARLRVLVLAPSAA